MRENTEVVMGGSSGRRTGRALLFLPLLSAIIAVIPCPSFSQILENLEIVFQKTYVDGAAPDSLWDWGRSIDCAGDVNNDGYDDIIVAANIETGDPLQPWLGKAYIFLGGNPMDTFPDVILTGSKYGSTVIHVAGVGDFNHDGYDDVIVGQDDGEKGVKIFFGGEPMDTIADLVLETRPGYSFADDIAGAGDVNGDSIDDCIVGDYSYNTLDGRALIFFGAAVPDSLPDVILNGHNNEGMGISVGGGGDLNGDGFDDVVVGADANSEAGFSAGKVYGFFGGGPMDTIPDVWVHGEGPNQSLGWYGVDIAKHDSTYDWLIVGSAFYPNGFPTASRGRIYVMYGDSVMDTLVDAYIDGRTDSSNLGDQTSWAGNVDGTGMGDIASCASPEYQSRGTTYLWLAGMPLDTVPDASARGQFQGQQPAWIVRTAGDVDGDGRDEVVFCNYAAATLDHAVWVAGYRETHVTKEYEHTCDVGLTRIFQNHPNPFSNRTIVPVRLVASQRSTLQIYNVKGNVVRDITLPAGPAGLSETQTHPVLWEGRDNHNLPVPSGVYFVRLNPPGRNSELTQTRKLVLIR